ncbi:MAG: hypothetical protein ABUS48_03710 [Pseudomonadota bacterium]
MIIWLVGWILLWFRPEYRFVLFFGIFLTLVDLALLVALGGASALFGAEGFSWPNALEYLLGFIIGRSAVLVVFFAIGCGIVALRKWMKNRKSPRDAQLDAEMERIRANIAARDGQPPAAT